MVERYRWNAGFRILNDTRIDLGNNAAVEGFLVNARDCSVMKTIVVLDSVADGTEDIIYLFLYLSTPTRICI